MMGLPFVFALVGFVIIGMIPGAYAQVVETKGQNYDLVDDIENKKIHWNNHPDRILVNGEWENYFLQSTDQKIIFKSNTIGGFVYDIPTCSYSIYSDGLMNTQIIPSVSAVATHQVNGVWQNMDVNQESCDVSFSQDDDGIFITSEKNSSQVISNSTNMNGTLTTTTIPMERYVQEIKVDIFSGVKETFKIWSVGDHNLGISQTVITGESITVGDSTLNIAEVSGQSFDKQFLEQNKAQVFEIAENLNYDFDTGFNFLTGMNVYHDNDYKVNLDYSGGDFVNYLEIDPTISTDHNNNLIDVNFDSVKRNSKVIDGTVTIPIIDGLRQKTCSLYSQSSYLNNESISDSFNCSDTRQVKLNSRGLDLMTLKQYDPDMKFIVKSSDGLIFDVDANNLLIDLTFQKPQVFAKLDSNGIVESVILADAQFISMLNGVWVESDHITGKTGIGFSYDSFLNKFISPQPYPSWILNTNGVWESSVEFTETGYTWNDETWTWQNETTEYWWNEDTLSWEIVNLNE